MPSTIHSKGNRSSPGGQLSKAEPELTPSTKRKISMLPDLKRQQLLEQQNSSTHFSVQPNDQAETVSQSSDQVAELSQAASDTGQSVKQKKSTRYTISSHSSIPVAATVSSQAADSPKMSEEVPPAINHHRKPSYVVNVTNFDVHRGKTAITRPPIMGDNLLSRLEGLRQFKEWSARIHDSAHQQADLPSDSGSRCSLTLSNGIHPIEKREQKLGVKVCSARIEHDLPLRHDSEVLERNIDAPTPFSSPMVTPVPSGTTHLQRQRQPTVSLPDLNLSAESSQDAEAHTRPRALSKTVVISAESPSLQLAPRSRSTSRTRPDTQVLQRANSKTRSRPPISFPKDFYERFPHIDETSTREREKQAQCSAKPSPGVSPKTVPAKPRDDQAVSDDIEQLAKPHDKRGRPTFYATIHYFTDCPHASPPANRPLDPNAQPRPDPDFHSFRGNTTHSIIPGACFNCDVTHRRNQEDQIININVAQMAQLTNKLAKVLDELELDESDDEAAGELHDKHSARLLTPSTFAEDKYDLDIETEGAQELPPLSDDPEVADAARSGRLRTTDQKPYLDRVVKEVRELEGQINQLHDQQDEQIKRVWSGFTPRWGPATLGVQRGRQVTSISRATSAENGKLPSQHPGGTRTDEVDEVQVVTAGAADQDLGGSTVSNSTSRGRSGSSRSRSGTRTPATTSSVSARDVPGSRTPGEGKMRIGWIREGKD